MLAQLAQCKPALVARFGITDIALFGSTARDTARHDSDIDILVSFDGPATSERYFGVHVPDAVRASNPLVPWRLVVATRNRLIHGYLGIDNDTLWSIIVSDVPACLAGRPACAQELHRLNRRTRPGEGRVGWWRQKERTMVTSDKPAELERVACEICLKEVPLSEATVPEAADYFVHFCGLECYERWKKQGQRPGAPLEPPKP